MATELSPSEWAVLGVVAEGTTHGFDVARALQPDGDVGRVWTVRRPLVYRAVATLAELGLIEEVGTAPGRAGPRRTLVRATRAGKSALTRWLAQPVAHVRDVRSQLLLKLVLLDRRGQDSGGLVRRQRQQLSPLLAGLAAQAASAEGFDAVLAQWRLESALAVDRFLASLSEAH